MIVDLFAGPGGWAEGLAQVGRRDVVGIDNDRDACATASAAGHTRLFADVAVTDPAELQGVSGLVGSPPCQAWSQAGPGRGEADRTACHHLADRMASGDDSTSWTTWQDPRSPLVCQPVRWVRDLRPPAVLLEEVPAVAGLWAHFARILTGWGYHCWVAVLNCADYGVPQTRRRSILAATFHSPNEPPEPTHSSIDLGPDLFGRHRQSWVTMAAALGWTPATPQLLDPAAEWVLHRPSTTVVGSFRPDVVSAPGYRVVTSRQNAPGSVRITLDQAAVLQGFAPGYPWRGSVSKRWQQAGNAIPPTLAAHLATAVGLARSDTARSAA